MRYSSLEDFLSRGRAAIAAGPVAIILVEDLVEADTTIRHHTALGFRQVVVLAPPSLELQADVEDRLARIDHAHAGEAAATAAVNRIIAAAVPGTWLYYCFNGEYLFFPFCETRTVSEMLAFHAEERRSAMLTYVVDLYAGDLEDFPDGVSLEDAHLDRSGYYALARHGPDGAPLERQLSFYGGLRWRYEEHVPERSRRIDRIALFRARAGLTLRADHTFSDQEYNTYACPWHHNLTAAIVSFRTAKALKANAGSTYDISTFKWHNSTEFEWHSQQLLDLGLMEPGQWF